MKKLRKTCSRRRGTTLPELFIILTKSNRPQATQERSIFYWRCLAPYELFRSLGSDFSVSTLKRSFCSGNGSSFHFSDFQKARQHMQNRITGHSGFHSGQPVASSKQQPKQEKERKPLTSCLRRTVDFPSRMSCRRTCGRKVGREPRISWATENGFAMK